MLVIIYCTLTSRLTVVCVENTESWYMFKFVLSIAVPRSGVWGPNMRRSKSIQPNTRRLNSQKRVHPYCTVLIRHVETWLHCPTKEASVQMEVVEMVLQQGFKFQWPVFPDTLWIFPLRLTQWASSIPRLDSLNNKDWSMKLFVM